MFDLDTSGQDCCSIFALSMLMSSVQIYNIKDVIGQVPLQQLEVITASYCNMFCGSSLFVSNSFKFLKWLTRLKEFYDCFD